MGPDMLMTTVSLDVCVLYIVNLSTTSILMDATEHKSLEQIK
jgi:hypothetical protein